MLQAGTVLAGKFRVDRVIGQGGMGMVVAATHLQLHQAIALKFLLPEVLHAPGVVERFLREARASAQLRGEHVCRVSDVGTLDHGEPYIVMELLQGHDLATVLHAYGPMPVGLAADYVLQACAGVAEAHALGIVHRDLKPANLFLTQRPDGSPLIKVLDFGIAKAPETNFSLTQTSQVLGSPGYMSPEQLRSSHNVDARSDVWSFGVILYELVSGRQPFQGESITELALHIAMDPTPPLVGNLPPGFGAIVERCLAKDPMQRFQDLAGLAQALAAYASPQGRDSAAGIARVLHGRATPMPSTPTTLGSATGQLAPTPRGNARTWIAAVAALVVVGGGIGIALALRGGDKTVAVATPPPPPPPAAAPPPSVDAAIVPAIVAPDAPPPVPPPVDAAAPDAAPAKRRPPVQPKQPTGPQEDLGANRL